MNQVFVFCLLNFLAPQSTVSKGNDTCNRVLFYLYIKKKKHFLVPNFHLVLFVVIAVKTKAFTRGWTQNFCCSRVYLSDYSGVYSLSFRDDLHVRMSAQLVPCHEIGKFPLCRRVFCIYYETKTNLFLYRVKQKTGLL